VARIRARAFAGCGYKLPYVVNPSLLADKMSTDVTPSRLRRGTTGSPNAVLGKATPKKRPPKDCPFVQWNQHNASRRGFTHEKPGACKCMLMTRAKATWASTCSRKKESDCKEPCRRPRPAEMMGPTTDGVNSASMRQPRGLKVAVMELESNKYQWISASPPVPVCQPECSITTRRTGVAPKQEVHRILEQELGSQVGMCSLLSPIVLNKEPNGVRAHSACE
jgi:hypothetical protein